MCYVLNILFIFFFFFFFSSRRRHTRLVSDWSSDVCSSDLVGGLHVPVAVLRDPLSRASLRRGGAGAAAAGTPRLARSEERRVGKECRSRGSPDHYKKKKEER